MSQDIYQRVIVDPQAVLLPKENAFMDTVTDEIMTAAKAHDVTKLITLYNEMARFNALGLFRGLLMHSGVVDIELEEGTTDVARFAVSSFFKDPPPAPEGDMQLYLADFFGGYERLQSLVDGKEVVTMRDVALVMLALQPLGISYRLDILNLVKTISDAEMEAMEANQTVQ